MEKFKQTHRAPQPIAGAIYNHWTVISTAVLIFTLASGKRATYWSCRCVCGRIKDVMRTNLTSGLSRSCGCQSRPDAAHLVAWVRDNPEKRIRGPKYNLVGERFGRLRVTEVVPPDRSENTKSRKYRWRCLCECGEECIVETAPLIKGGQRSCKCLQRESARERQTKHGLSDSRIYRVYQGMKTRCTNPAAHNYDAYGARGIQVCTAWLESFETFVSDMGHPPTPYHSLDRVDTNGDYTPENCRWATREQQANNRRNTRRLAYAGVEKSVSDWAREFGVPAPTMVWWVRKHGQAEAFRRATKRKSDREMYPTAFSA